MFFIVNFINKNMKKLTYDGSKLTQELINRKASYKDTAAVGELIVFLQSDQGILKDSDFEHALPFIKTTSIKRLLDRLHGKILNIKQYEGDLRVRVIEWIIDWMEFVYEVEV